LTLFAADMYWRVRKKVGAIDGLRIGEIRLRDGGRIARDGNIKTYLQSRSFADLASSAPSNAALRIYPLLFLVIPDPPSPQVPVRSAACDECSR
jgi:hypothetical protein